MTRNNLLCVAGEPVTAVLVREHDRLVNDLLAELVAHVPVYGRLPRELLDGDVHRVADRALRLFGSSLETPVSAEDLAGLTESAVRRAEEGVPMEMVIAAYFRGAGVVSDYCIGRARPEELPDVRQLFGHVLEFMEATAAAVAAGYAAYGQSSHAEQANARQLLLNALLTGDGYREAAGPAQIDLAPTYLVASIAVGQHPDENDPDVDGSVASRRKLRRLREELQRHYADPVLWMPVAQGGLTLVPGEDYVRLARVVGELQRAAGAVVHAGVVEAEVDGIPKAARLAHEVLGVARGLGRPGGSYRLADVALEFQLRQASAARPVLAAMLDPLDAHPGLRETLEVFMSTALNRRRTASLLQVHPNTVDNRLRKVAALVGMDPTSAADLPLITAALAARS